MHRAHRESALGKDIEHDLAHRAGGAHHCNIEFTAHITFIENKYGKSG
jgi:hypothetical protein